MTAITDCTIRIAVPFSLTISTLGKGILQPCKRRFKLFRTNLSQT